MAPKKAKVATSGGRHGAVAGTIHGGVHNYYQVPADATPDEKLRYALRYLESGQATTARRLLDEVVVDIGDQTEVWFWWLLAFFSGRTLWELPIEDRHSLVVARERIRVLRRDLHWTRGIDVIDHLVEVTGLPVEDPERISGVLLDLDRLDDTMRKGVLRHLERVLQGHLKDEVWHREVEQARAERLTGGRPDRVWKFFEPDPARPRTRRVPPAETSPEQLLLIALTVTVATAATGLLAWLSLQRGDSSAPMSIVVMLTGAAVAMVNAAEWRFQLDRQRVAAGELRRFRFADPSDQLTGFAAKVNNIYNRCVLQVDLSGDDRTHWIRESRVPLSRLRDELVEVYREERVKAAEVKWLIRFQVEQVHREWVNGTLADQRRRWAVPVRARILTVGGALAAWAGILWAAQSAAREDLLMSLAAVVAVVIGGGVAAAVGVQELAGRRRFAVEEADRQSRMTSYWLEYQRWSHVLADRPRDPEMARWLDCDRRVLLNHALEAYKLRWSDVSAYASLEARGDNSIRARAKNGPWRYSRYKLLVFLLTTDGVRQITVDLNFAKASYHDWQRTNYRYDAVAAARVAERDNGGREFQLFLVNGDDIEVVAVEAGEAEADEDDSVLTDGAQDASGLRNTLFVLEGLAAEGRSWWAGPAYRRAS